MSCFLVWLRKVKVFGESASAIPLSRHRWGLHQAPQGLYFKGEACCCRSSLWQQLLCASATLAGTPKEKAVLLSGVSEASLFGLFNSRAQLGSQVASPSFASSTVKLIVKSDIHWREIREQDANWRQSPLLRPSWGISKDRHSEDHLRLSWGYWLCPKELQHSHDMVGGKQMKQHQVSNGKQSFENSVYQLLKFKISPFGVNRMIPHSEGMAPSQICCFEYQTWKATCK